MTKTYGELRHGDVGTGEMFGVRAVPHVALKIKRIFPRADSTRPGIIMLRDTPEVARDLEWFMDRWPLTADPAVRAHLEQRAQQHRDTEDAVTAILAGYQPPNDWREPAITARGYQLEADAIVHATGRLLLGDDLGLGKTLSALLRLRDPEALPALVVCPVHLCKQWLAELGKFLPWLHGHIATKSTPYDPTAKRGAGKRQPDVWIMSYAKLAGWADHLAGQVQTVIFDECHELRTGPGTYKWTAAAQVAEKARFRIGASATPVANYGGEIHNVVSVLDRDALGSATEFVREWCGAPAGMARHNMVTDPAMLGAHLRDAGIMLVRTRKQLHMELPDPIQIEQPVDTDHATIDKVAASVMQQARILTGEIAASYTERGQAALDLDWKLRQATGIAKAPFVAELAKLILESEDRIVMWAWHRGVHQILTEALAEYRPVLYTGTESPAVKQRNAEAFMGGGARVLLMSLRSGAGLDGLQKWCSVGVFAELDWSPAIHAQCLGRLHRDGQAATVVAYFPVSDSGTDPLMAEVLGVKRAQSVPIRDPESQLFTALTDPADRAKRLAADMLARLARTPVPAGLPAPASLAAHRAQRAMKGARP